MGNLDYLDNLEAEAIFIFREALRYAKEPALLFSGGKDSATLGWIARKAFYPEPIPFSFLHIDTGRNFAETLLFRNEFCRALEVDLIVRTVDHIPEGFTRNEAQSITLCNAQREFSFDFVFGGARRDEEKARAKERIFSFRGKAGGWTPENQRPEIGLLFNLQLKEGEHLREFPLSNWTEKDIWTYIQRESIPLPSLYFSHQRECVRRENGALVAVLPPEVATGQYTVRGRTVGDMECTGLIESRAMTTSQVLEELEQGKTSERALRLDDRRRQGAMEDRKRAGYF